MKDQKPDTERTICSFLTCKVGHTWFPHLAIGHCPGCKAPILALKMENCPICNEPSINLTLRMDHFTSSMQIAPLCQGAKTLAEVGTLDIPLNAYKEAEVLPEPHTTPTAPALTTDSETAPVSATASATLAAGFKRPDPQGIINNDKS